MNSFDKYVTVIAEIYILIIINEIIVSLNEKKIIYLKHLKHSITPN